MLKKLLLLAGSGLFISIAQASFCDTYTADHGTGVCVNVSAAANTQPGTSNALSASAVFEVSGNNLNVTLVNDDVLPNNANQLGGADVLTALLFNITNTAGNEITLNPLSIGLTPSLTTNPANPLGTATITDGSDASQLGWEWGLGSDSHYYSNQATLTSTGLVGNLQNGNFNCGANCDVLDGPKWGVVPASVPNGIAPGINTLVQNYVFFSLSGLSGSGLTAANLSSHLRNIVFQYGTAFGTEPVLVGQPPNTPVPEPSFIGFAALALVATIVVRRQSQRRA
ncbi:MAG: hypothetical protein C5B51_02000 [Terriglobia bacterium]|nr:MAG: hypothetical protein C5B51_02000 [Terriglobia bacterium]